MGQLTTINLDDQKFEQTHLVVCDVAMCPIYQYTYFIGTIVNNVHIWILKSSVRDIYSFIHSSKLKSKPPVE